MHVLQDISTQQMNEMCRIFRITLHFRCSLVEAPWHITQQSVETGRRFFTFDLHQYEWVRFNCISFSYQLRLDPDVG